MKIYITRHGETEWNLEKRMQGSSNSNLTDKGREEAGQLAESLKDIDFSFIYSSPLGRAYDTAKILCEGRKKEIILRDNLKEMSFGVWEGLSSEEVIKLYSEEYQNFWNYPNLYTAVNGAESYDDFLARIKNEMEYIINNSYGENILLVVHGAVIKAIFNIFKGYKLEEFWSADPFVYNTCLSILEIKDNKRTFILEGDISHLK